MSINELLNSGIEIQGNIKISQWINDEEKILYEGEAERISRNVNYTNMRITYMFSVDRIGLVIEVE